MSVKSDQYIGFLEFVKRILLIDLLCSFEPIKGLLRLTAVVSDHAHVGVEHGRPLIHLNRALQQLRCLVELFLLQAYVAEAPPCVVVPLIRLKSSLVASFGLVEIFIRDILMSAQSVSICEIVIQLNCPREEFERCFVLFLQ